MALVICRCAKAWIPTTTVLLVLEVLTESERLWRGTIHDCLCCRWPPALTQQRYICTHAHAGTVTSIDISLKHTSPVSTRFPPRTTSPLPAVRFMGGHPYYANSQYEPEVSTHCDCCLSKQKNVCLLFVVLVEYCFVLLPCEPFTLALFYLRTHIHLRTCLYVYGCQTHTQT